MTNEQVIQIVTQRLQALLAAHPEHFLVDIKIKPTNNIKIFLDGDKGIGIDDLVKYNRALYKQFEEEAIFPVDDFSLEISSAGLDEPLKSPRQYLKNINRDVEVLLLEGKTIAGNLLSFNEDNIVVAATTGKGKKAETVMHTISLHDIKTTKIQIKF